jgi:hypothetical protein
MARDHAGRHSGETESDLVSGLKRALASAKAGQRSLLDSIQNISGLPQGFLLSSVIG